MNKWIKRAALTLVAFVAAEQSFLHFYLDNVAIHQDAAFRAYLESLGPRKQRFGELRPWDCGTARIATYYTFKMCVYDYASGDASESRRYVLYAQKPAGYLTLVPWNSESRWESDSAEIFGLNEKLEPTDDLRRGS